MAAIEENPTIIQTSKIPTSLDNNNSNSKRLGNGANTVNKPTNLKLLNNKNNNNNNLKYQQPQKPQQKVKTSSPSTTTTTSSSTTVNNSLTKRTLQSVSTFKTIIDENANIKKSAGSAPKNVRNFKNNIDADFSSSTTKTAIIASSSNDNATGKSSLSVIPLTKKKSKFSNVKSRVSSLDNIEHVPKQNERKIFDEKPKFTNVRSRIGSLDNITHTPKSTNLRIFDEKPKFTSVKSRIGSLDNISHTPKSEHAKIFDEKPKFMNVKSRIGSLDNITHTPKSTNLKIFDEKPKFTNVKSRVGSLDNINHVPKGGDKPIFSSMPKHDHVKSRVGSLDKVNHVPQGGDVKIFHEKLDFRGKASPKIVTNSNLSACGSSLGDNDMYLVRSPTPQEQDEEDVNEQKKHENVDEDEEGEKERDTNSNNNNDNNDNNIFNANQDEGISSKVEEPVRTIQEEESNFQALNDTELSFEVNVTRKTILLAQSERESINESNPLPLSNDAVELTNHQQRLYDESWI